MTKDSQTPESSAGEQSPTQGQSDEQAAIDQIRKDGEELISYAFLINKKGQRLLKMADAFQLQLDKETAQKGKE